MQLDTVTRVMVLHWHVVMCLFWQLYELQYYAFLCLTIGSNLTLRLIYPCFDSICAPILGYPCVHPCFEISCFQTIDHILDGKFCFALLAGRYLSAVINGWIL